jgi:hypothetical protein
MECDSDCRISHLIGKIIFFDYSSHPLLELARQQNPPSLTPAPILSFLPKCREL